jgi:hypothetical protein
MTSARKFLIVTLAGMLLGGFLNAQQSVSQPSTSVPRLVNFSGKAVDAQGKTITGIAGVTFAIYADQVDGASLWMETQNLQADTKGNYTVQLGATKPDGLPLDLFTSGGARWLGVTIDGGQEQPRILLLSVPYALKAADAEAVGGLPASAFIRANQSQENAPAVSATQTALTSSTTKSNPAVTGEGTAHFIPMWNSTSDILDSIIFQKSSQIGIGTSSPEHLLDVFSSQSSDGPIARLGSNGTSDSDSLQIYTGSGTAETFVSGCAGCFVPGAQEGDGGMRVTPGKNIFFGDSTASRLEIDSSGNAYQPPTANGMVKAMFLYSPFSSTGSFTHCFNSTLSGAAATTPPCGFTVIDKFVGDYVFDLGFEVDDRFLSSTPSVNPYKGTEGIAPLVVSVCTDITGVDGNTCNNPAALNQNRVEVTSFYVPCSNCIGGYYDSKVYLIVY